MNILNLNVLVLNKQYLAIKVCSVKDAICILYKGQAKVIDDYYETYNLSDWVIKSAFFQKNAGEFEKYKHILSSPSVKFLVPKVIILTNETRYIQELKNVRYSRKNVLLRDNFTCSYCGYQGIQAELTLDHVIPRSKGGGNSFKNIVTACKECNLKKGNKTLQEVGMELSKQPTVPKWKSFIGSPFNKSIDKYWKKFL
jgi:5-methylcytosine-specific restriction endonuclease McrA